MASENRKVWRLTQDTPNPKPDRRRKLPSCLPVWPAGTIFIHTEVTTCEGSYGIINFVRVPGAERFNYCSEPTNSETGQALLAAQKEEVPTTLDVLGQMYQLGPSWWLAALIEEGKVSIGDVEGVAKRIQECPEGSDEDMDFNAMFRKHGV